MVILVSQVFLVIPASLGILDSQVSPVTLVSQVLVVTPDSQV